MSKMTEHKVTIQFDVIGFHITAKDLADAVLREADKLALTLGAHRGAAVSDPFVNVDSKQEQ